MVCVDHSLEEALAKLASGDTQILAGGTDYYPGLRDATPSSKLIDLRSIEGLRTIENIDGVWRIGAAVTWTDLINAKLPACFDCLKQAGREVGSVQIQNSATLVGNLCNASPAADGVPALLVLNAKIEIRSDQGVRLMPLSDFITGVRKINLSPNEIVTAIVIPDTLSGDCSEFIKLGARSYLVISIVMCATRLQVDNSNIITDAAIAVGACSPVAQRLTQLEQSLVGQSCSEQGCALSIKQDYFDQLSPIDDVRATAQYRLHALAVLLQRQLDSVSKKIAAGISS